MGFNILQWLRAFTDQDLDWPCQYRMVALALGKHANKAGECYPSERTLEREAGVSRHTVIRVMRLLETGGWCTRDTTHGKSTRYKLVSDVHQCLPCTSAPETPVSDVHHGGAPGIPVGGAPETPELLSTNNSITTQPPPRAETRELLPVEKPGWFHELDILGERFRPDSLLDARFIGSVERLTAAKGWDEQALRIRISGIVWWLAEDPKGLKRKNIRLTILKNLPNEYRPPIPTTNGHTPQPSREPVAYSHRDFLNLPDRMELEEKERLEGKL